MGWTLTGCSFQHNNQVTNVHALGNNAAWICPECKTWPVLFVYRGVGGNANNPVHCMGCNSAYHLDPQFGATPEPPRGEPTQPHPVMTIV